MRGHGGSTRGSFDFAPISSVNGEGTMNPPSTKGCDRLDLAAKISKSLKEIVA
jgi:hypothetical protein